MDMFGPTTLRRNDSALLQESRINERFRSMQVGSSTQFVVFRDSAYIRQSHIMSYNYAADMRQLQNT